MGKTLGQKVRIERATLGINQEELAKRVGVSRGYISDIERGSEAINIGKNTVIALAQALGISAAYLFGLTDNPLEGIEDDEAPAAAQVQPADFAGNHFLSVFFSLKAADQELLITIAEKLKRADTPRIIGEQ